MDIFVTLSCSWLGLILGKQQRHQWDFPSPSAANDVQ